MLNIEESIVMLLGENGRIVSCEKYVRAPLRSSQVKGLSRHILAGIKPPAAVFHGSLDFLVLLRAAALPITGN